MSRIFQSLVVASAAGLIGLLGSSPILAEEEASTAVHSQAAKLSFPREFSSATGRVVIHAPQIDTWTDFAVVDARAAVAVTPVGEDEPAYGVVEFTADTDANLELRVVAVENARIAAISFPVSDDSRREQLDQIVRSAVQPRTQYVPLDVILSYIAPEAKLPEEPGLSMDPPPIFYSSTPAVLLIIDGEPLLAPLGDSKLQYVVNTNWDLFRYKEKEWYLRHGSVWLKNKELDGDWKSVTRLPRDFSKLPEDGNWSDARAAMPPAKGAGDAPTVLVSDRPAELIVIDGKPSYRTVGGPGLEYVDNTESDLFLYEKRFFYLVSGRWFSADQPRGPWEHVKELPAAFAAIAADHEKGHVLAAVPNTEEARLAALEAALPRKATIRRDAGQNVTTFYQGEPKFEPISGTGVERAVNSPNDILRVGDQYYLCDDAVWYVATKANGPWVVADTIPAEIYSIPPSSSAYHVTHVHVYESDDDSVSTGYTSGYFGVYVGLGVAMYGSGWYYPSYYGYYPYSGYPYYPYYYPYPYSYGSAAWYNPNTGMYGRSGSIYGPYGGYGRAAAYNPKTGTYARGSAVWDSNEIAASGAAYNPRTGTGIATNRYASENGGWGESLVTHNDKWLKTQSQWDADSRTTQFTTSGGGEGQIETRRSGDNVIRSGEFQRGDQTLSTKSVRGDQGAVVGARTGTGTGAAIGRSTDGDLYAGKDGQVYKRGEDGWYQHGGEDGWNKVDVPDERAAQMDQKRNEVAERRDTDAGSRLRENPVQNRDAGRSGAGGFSQRKDVGGRLPNRSLDSSRSARTFDASRRNELNRSRTARTNGYQRYNNRSSMSRQSRGGRRMPHRRR